MWKKYLLIVCPVLFVVYILYFLSGVSGNKHSLFIVCKLTEFTKYQFFMIMSVSCLLSVIHILSICQHNPLIEFWSFFEQYSTNIITLCCFNSPSASKAKIKEAHKRIMLLNHPDRGTLSLMTYKYILLVFHRHLALSFCYYHCVNQVLFITCMFPLCILFCVWVWWKVVYL